jgi:hypothetical protein
MWDVLQESMQVWQLGKDVMVQLTSIMQAKIEDYASLHSNEEAVWLFSKELRVAKGTLKHAYMYVCKRERTIKYPCTIVICPNLPILTKFVHFVRQRAE